MFYISYNANPKARNIRDCVVRAVSLAFDKDYYIAYQELTFHALMEKQGWLFNYPESYSGYLEEMGCIEIESFKDKANETALVIADNNVALTSTPYLSKLTNNDIEARNNLAFAVDLKIQEMAQIEAYAVLKRDEIKACTTIEELNLIELGY